MNRSFVFSLIFVAMLGGCNTSEGQFPSLSRRPFEGGTPIQAPVVAPVPVASSLPGSFAGQVGALQARHNKAAGAYAALLPGTRQVASAARGTAQGSEAWVNAHVVISRLDHARADSVAALAEFDNLVAKRFDAEEKGAFPLIMPLLTPVQANMAASVAAQNAEIERLSLLVGL
jgi:hypothetical protein